MSYSGYLLKLGSDTFPMDYIIAKSYKVTPNQRQDLNSTRTASGNLKRHVVNNMPSKIEFQLSGKHDILDDADVEACMSFIRKHFTNSNERKVSATFYCPDTNTYKTENMYMPDTEYTIDWCDESHVYFSDYTIKFIGY